MVSQEDILKQIKQSVHATDPGATLILYGSYARGDYHDESDIDILVLLDKDRVTVSDRMRIAYPLYHLELEVDRHISPVFRARHLWETKHTITPFYKNVAREGVTL